MLLRKVFKLSERLRYGIINAMLRFDSKPWLSVDNEMPPFLSLIDAFSKIDSI